MSSSSQASSAPRSRAIRRLGFLARAIALVVAGAIGGWWWQSRAAGPAANLAASDRAAIEQVVREYILAHPEILPEAMENLQKRESAKQLSGVRKDIENPYPGAVLGNPAGKVTLVEFSDFACTYCRQSLADVESLIAANADLRVVIRELPILSPDSATAARWALAAADQGKFAAFHKAMFLAGRPNAQTIEAAARAAGLDLERAKRSLADPRIEAELERNIGFARQLGFNGTPSWVIGEQIFAGAIGKDALAKAIADAR